MNRKTFLVSVALVVSSLCACQHPPYVKPEGQRTGDPELCFQRDILPIFLSQCAKSGCHDAAAHEKEYVLDSYENIIKKGIAPGNAQGSKIYNSLLGTAAKQMPEDAPPLSMEQIALIKRWIDAGALKDNNCLSACDSNNYLFNTGVKPLINKYCLGCHSGSQPQGNLSLSGYDAVKVAVQTRHLLECINYVNGYPVMPQGLKLSDCEIRQVEKWVEAGMPDN